MVESEKEFLSIKRYRTLFLIIAACLFIVEVQVFVVALQNSGRQATLKVKNDAGEVIYTTDGTSLTSFDKYYFEKTWGPLENYTVAVETREVPFPFRAWFFAAVGIPVGALLLIAFVFRAYQELVQGGRKKGSDEDGTPMESLLGRISRLPVFMMGALVFVGAFALWALPNAAAFLGRESMELVLRFKWFLLGAVLVMLTLSCWVIYLRYQLAKRNIDARTEVNKYRLELEYRARAEGLASPRLDYTEAELLPGVEEEPGADESG
ncbi:MAG: hypothetical protein ACLFOY_09220 [Desulfatibacillaceae bacterium]